MTSSPEHRGAAKIEKYVRLGAEDGALNELASHRMTANLDETVPSLDSITGGRYFWLIEQQKHTGRKLHENVPGVVGFDLASAGQRGSLAIVELPDSHNPAWRTTRYLDTSHEAFRGLDEEEFCIKSVATAAHYYLSLAKQVHSSGELAALPSRNGDRPLNGVPARLGANALSVPILGSTVQPA